LLAGRQKSRLAHADLADADELVHADWLALLLDRETSWRKDKRLTARRRAARLRQQASIEDVDYRAARGLDRALFQTLSEGEWIDAHDNLALVGPAGVGKSWLACAIGHKACRDNRSVLYHRWPKLCGDLVLARGDGRHPRLIKALGRADLLILDDFGLAPLDAGARHDLLEILEERYGRRSTIVTSQLPLSAWHEVIGDPTYADAIVDRLAQCASHRTHRREPAPRPRQKFENGWTCNPTVGTKSLGQQARRPRAGSSRFRERLRRNRHLCWGSRPSRALGAVFLVRDRAVRHV
jgi:DNA replication protein DnaC